MAPILTTVLDLEVLQKSIVDLSVNLALWHCLWRLNVLHWADEEAFTSVLCGQIRSKFLFTEGSRCRFLLDTPSKNPPLLLFLLSLLPLPSYLPPERLMSLCWHHVMGGDTLEFTRELLFSPTSGNLRLTYRVAACSAQWLLKLQHFLLALLGKLQ